MLDTLLRTKLFVPPLRPNLVRRPQLVEQLNHGLQLGHRLTLISAPAGFGKTTLVSHWAAQLRADGTQERGTKTGIAWLGLDESDSDVTRFLTYFIAALNEVGGLATTVGKTALPMLQSAQESPIEPVLTMLINEITAIQQRVVFVLDDHHLLDSAPVDEALSFFVDHLPPQIHLVIVTRTDPYLPLARYRARGQLTELRAADLRFTTAETAAFLKQVMGLNLTAVDIAALESRTEGWIAGLQLTAISMKGREDLHTFIESFTGSHYFVLDYLIEDVLEQQAEQAQAFLLQTAILQRMNGSLCDALTGLDNGQAMLETLERENLFIVPLDEERGWYRYHRLFADVLRQRLQQTEPDRALMLHERASTWYEQNGYSIEAIDHALEAERFQRAARLIDAEIDAVWRRGERGKLQRWLDGLPQQTIFSKPDLLIFQARYQCNRGELDAAEETLKTVERALASKRVGAAFTEAERTKLRGRTAATRALICSYDGDVPGIIRMASEALTYLPQTDLSWRSITALTLGNAYGFLGDMPAAYEARAEALRACEATGDVYFVIMANLELAITLREQGRLRRTIDICEQQLQIVNESGLSEASVLGWLLAVWGETLAELNDLSGARERAQRGFELTERSGDLQMFGWSFICLVRVLISSGDWAGAETALQKMARVGHKAHLPPWIRSQMAAWQARLWLAQNNLAAAGQWVEDSGLNNGEGSEPRQEAGFFLLFDYLVLARILIAQGRWDEALKLLQEHLQTAEASGRGSSVITILVLQALAWQAGGDMKRAVAPLERALTLAEPNGFARIFVDEGRPMARLLGEARKRGLVPAFASRLLAAFAAEGKGPVELSLAQADQSALVEPLSERELEVLQKLAEGLSNRQIAERLYLSLNTVKVHTRNIYGKLGVNNRTQAVARARELGILPTS
jgi:LuxR family maltose regulon positive regulatory protein